MTWISPSFGRSAAGTARRGVILFRLHDPRIQRLQARLAVVLAECGAALREGAVVLVEDRRHRVPRAESP